MLQMVNMVGVSPVIKGGVCVICDINILYIIKDNFRVDTHMVLDYGCVCVSNYIRCGVVDGLIIVGEYITIHNVQVVEYIATHSKLDFFLGGV